MQPLNLNGALENSIGSFLGAKLGSLIYSPQTQAGEIAGSIGASLGALASTTGASLGILSAGLDVITDAVVDATAELSDALADAVFNTVLPGVGALIGFVLGGLIGDLFGSKPKIPTASAQTVLAIPSASYQLGAQTSTNGGDLSTPIAMATLARDTLNGILQQITGVNGGTVQNLSSPTQAYGYDGTGLYVMLGVNASKTYVSTADQAVDKGVLWALPQTQVIGGDIFLKRAIDDTAAAPDVTTLMGNLQVASDYEFYCNNRALINAEITAAYATLTSSQMSFYNTNKALVDQVDSQGVASLNASQQQTYNANASTIGTIITALQAQSVANPWIITLQRADELGLDKFQTSDFYGGLKGFVDSFSSNKGVYENISLGWDGGGLYVQDVYANIFNLPQANSNGSSVYIANFLSTMSYTGLGQGQTVTNGNDFEIGASSGQTIDSWNNNVPRGGNDIFIGESGNDWIATGTGSSWVDAGAGDDYLAAPAGNAVLLGGAGNDTIEVGASSNPAPGTYYLSGGSGNDTLIAHAGLATFVGGTGTDTETGGSGKNTYLVDPSDMTASSSSSTLVISGSGNYNTLSFARVTANVYVDLRSDDTNHSFGNGSPQAGMQQVSTDTFVIPYTTVTISDIQSLTGGSGNDWFCNTAAMTSTLSGGAGNDDLNGWGVNNTLEGGPGADIIDGWYGVNTVTYEGSSAGVYVNLATGEAYGGDADGDVLEGSLQNLTGSAYDDTLVGTSAANTLSGNAGDDTFVYSGGGDAYLGGDGFDTVDYSGAGSAITVNLQNGSSGGAASGDSYSSIEKIIGTRYNDTLTGNSSGDTFEGGGGTDTISGGSGSDTYILGRGDGSTTVSDNNSDSNTIQIGPGLGFDDLTWGTQGPTGSNPGVLQLGIRGDTADIISITGNFAGSPSNDVAKTLTLNGTSPVDISRVNYSPMNGDDNANVIYGYPSNFVLEIGNGGNDTLSSDQSDVGNNTNTQNGNIYDGGLGNDTIYSSNGDDQYLFERGDGHDVIHDTGGTNTLVLGSTVSASDVIYQVVYNSSEGKADLYIGLKDLSNSSLTASQVSDYVEVVGGGTQTYNENTGNTLHAPTINEIEVGGTTINTAQAGIPWYQLTTSGPGGGGGKQPVVLDLSGSGLELSSVETSDVATVDGNGVVTRLGWVGPTNGILVSDRDGTGVYNTTDDISFIQDKPGATSDLQGLQGWDTNGDGVLNAQDTDWNKLKVWVDANQDGVAEASEVETLAQEGISSISLKETPSGFDPSTTFDSYYTGTAAFTRTNGTTSTAYDVTLAREFLDQSTDAQSGSEAWTSLTSNATIGQIQGTVTPFASAATTLATSIQAAATSLSPLFTTSAAQAAASGGVATVNTLGSGKISSQDAAIWQNVLNPAAAQANLAAELASSAAALAQIKLTSPYPAGYDELTGRSDSSSTQTARDAEPVVLDLAGVGLSQIAPTASSVSFDAAHTGQPQTVGWIGPNDAVLAFDANGDGQVDPATEITFKPDVAVATNSLGGLASFDTNGNGYLDPGDASWSKFLVWRDANSDGVSEPGETETLTQAGVAKLALTPTTTTPDNGDPSANQVLAQSTLTLTDGTVRTAYDLALGVEGASSTSATPATTAAGEGAAADTTPAAVTPVVKAAAVPQSSANSLVAQTTAASVTQTGSDTSLARAAEDGPQTPQGAQYGGIDDQGAVSGWWSAASSTGLVLGASGLSSLTLDGTSKGSSLAAPISPSPDAATLQQQQLLRQSLASFTAPASSASAVWTRQPAADLLPTLAAATAKPLAYQGSALATLAG